MSDNNFYNFSCFFYLFMQLLFRPVPLRLTLIFLLIASLQVSVKAQQGTLSPNAIVLNATEISDFHEGYAIIRKEQEFAIIDKNGGYLVPFGKYKFNELRGFKIDERNCGFRNGMCVARDEETELYGFINDNGKLVVPCTLKQIQPYMDDGFAWGREETQQGRTLDYFFDKAGNRFAVKEGATYLYENTIPLEVYKCTDGIYSKYYHKTGRLVFKTARRKAYGYSDGLIKIDSTIGLAGEKTGFIDTLGRLVIPCKFKSNVKDFCNGYAMLFGTNADEYKYAFIDKLGEIVLKINNSEKAGEVYMPDANSKVDFGKGFIRISYGGKSFLMDIQGNLFDIKKGIESNNDKFASRYKMTQLVSHEENADFILFNEWRQWDEKEIYTIGGIGPDAGKQEVGSKQIQSNDYGLADLQGNIILEPIFWRLGFLDPASNLAKGSIRNRLTNKVVSGYINKSGIMVMRIPGE